MASPRMFAVVLVTAFGLAPTPAFAQQAPTDEAFHVADDPDAVAAQAAATEQGPEALQRAREAFLEGRRLMGEERWAEAAAAFEIALRARPTPGLHYHSGLCLERKGDLLEARRAYVAAQGLLDEQPAADVAALLPAAIRRVEARLSRFTVRLLPSSAVAWLDGVKLVAPYPEWLTPGEHALRAEAAGHEALHLHFEAVAGKPKRIEATLPPLPVVPVAAVAAVAVAEEDPDEAPPAPRSPVPRAVFWGSVTFGALGLAAGAAGTVWHVTASEQVARAHEELGQTGDSACYGPTASVDPTCQQLRSAVAAEESAAILLVGGFVAAGLGVAGALTSWAVWPSERFAVSGRAGFGSVRLELRGRF